MRPGIAIIVLAFLAGCSREPGPQLNSRQTTPTAATARNIVDAEVSARRVLSGPGFVDTGGGPSPDGRYMSGTDWETGDLAVRDLAAGTSRRVTNKGSWADSDEFAEWSVFSPDGRHIAYGWNNGEFYEVRVIDVDGSGVRTLYRNRELGTTVEPHTWSPDGTQVLVTLFGVDGTARIALVPVAGGAARMLKSFDWRHPFAMDFSRDGRFIAYDLPPDKDSPRRDVYTLALSGGRQARVTEGSKNEQLLGWSPDGAWLLVLESDAGSRIIKRVPVRDGRPAGEAYAIRADAWNVWPIGFSRNAYFNGVFTDHPRVYTLGIDVATGRAVGAPQVATEGGERGLSPAWSPDGSHLAYIAGPTGRAPRSLVIRSLQTGKARELMPRLQYMSQLAWAADGRSLVVRGRSKGRVGLFHIDLKTADVRPITYGAGSAYALSPDARTLYYSSGSEGRTGGGIVARDLASGREQMLPLPKPANDNLAVSPDGRWLVFTTREQADKKSRLLVAPVQGGDFRVLHELREPANFPFGVVAWTPDGTHILLVKRVSDEDWANSLYAIPATGGEARQLLSFSKIWRVRMNPDGRRLAFEAGNDKAEVWVLENLPDGRRRADAGGTR